MINFKGKNSSNLQNKIQQSGYSIHKIDGNFVTSNDTEVQSIIDNYEPLPELQKQFTDVVNKTAGEARTRYVTDIPFQEAAYQAKEADVLRYRADGYPSDLTLYPFTAAEANATGKTPQDAADTIIAQANGWVFLSSEIERLRRKANIEISRCTDWQIVGEIAEEYIQKLEAI